MEFLEIPLVDDDILKLLVRFFFNLTFLVIIVRMIYYPAARKNEYLFTYFMINILVFFICFTLKKFELELGMALGLFALFGILRYRTDAIPIKEMTYLFIVIGLAVVNSLANKKMSYVELFFTNFAIIGAVLALEKLELFNREIKMLVRYEKIELLPVARRAELIKDLEERTGLKIDRVEVQEVDFLRDTAEIFIYYHRDSAKPKKQIAAKAPEKEKARV